MIDESVLLHWIWRETSNRLSVLHSRVLEGSDLMVASEFARWLRMSGILKLFAAHPQAEPWSVDVKRIEKQIGDMLLECGERLQRAQPGMVEASALERVNTKLELIAGELVRLSMKQEQSGRRTTKANASRRPKLRVLPSVTT